MSWPVRKDRWTLAWEGIERMIFNTPDRVAALTSKWSGERSADGRPRVSEDILARMRDVTNDEAWGVVEKTHGYNFQFEGDWFATQPDLILTGRVVTAQMVPNRPYLRDVVQEIGTGE